MPTAVTNATAKPMWRRFVGRGIDSWELLASAMGCGCKPEVAVDSTPA
jgi:hypothetical protein